MPGTIERQVEPDRSLAANAAKVGQMAADSLPNLDKAAALADIALKLAQAADAAKVVF
jgi:hypothetical protein